MGVPPTLHASSTLEITQVSSSRMYGRDGVCMLVKAWIQLVHRRCICQDIPQCIDGVWLGRVTNCWLQQDAFCKPI